MLPITEGPDQAYKIRVQALEYKGRAIRMSASRRMGVAIIQDDFGKLKMLDRTILMCISLRICANAI